LEAQDIINRNKLYKTKRDSRTPQLEDDDRKNLAKALSGFANSSGGVLLWGVKGNPVPTLMPITQIQIFMENLLQLGGLATEPSILGIDGM
jgi:predicted HTH transcriptional regulator